MAKGFGGRGGMGGMGMNANMLKQAQKMQQDMMRTCSRSSRRRSTTASSRVVTATVTGKRELKALEIDPEAVDPDDVEMLQDMIDRDHRQRGAARRYSFHHAETDRRARTAGLRGTTPHPPGRDPGGMGRFFTAGGRREEGGEKPGKAERKKVNGNSGRTAETDLEAPIPGLIGRSAVPTIISML